MGAKEALKGSEAVAVYEIMLFFNEVELAELHIHETADVVDRWIVVEAKETFSGRPKSLNWHRVVPHLGKLAQRVEYVTLNAFSPRLDCWGREFASREAGLRGIKRGHRNDWVIVSDADEVPRPEAIVRYDPEAGPAMFQVREFNYWLNVERLLTNPMRCNRMTTLRALHRMGGVQALRRSGGAVLEDAGWHFSYMGGADRVRAKVGAYSHQEYNTATMAAPGQAEQIVGELLSIDGKKPGCPTVVRQIDETFPRYLREHAERFAHMIRPPW